MLIPFYIYCLTLQNNNILVYNYNSYDYKTNYSFILSFLLFVKMQPTDYIKPIEFKKMLKAAELIVGIAFLHYLINR